MHMSKKKTTVPSSRITTLDLLRGYFMVSIILNHLQWFPSGFDWISIRGSLFVTAAEGFFLISGIILGIVRGQKLVNEPFKKVALIVLSRGVKLYIVAVILMLLFTFIGWLFIDNPGLKPGIRPIDQPLYEIILGALSFDYIYGWADFLRLYAIFLIASPLALWALRKGKWYIVTAISVLLWALFPLAQLYSGQTDEILMILSWQFIFFSGLTIGFHWNSIQAWWKGLAKKTRTWILVPILSVAAITLATNIIYSTLVILGILPEPMREFYTYVLGDTIFDKDALTIPRLLLFTTWFILGLTLFTRYEKQITKWFGWLLLPFGQNSLYVYIMQAIVLFFVHLLLPASATDNFFINFIGTLIVFAIIVSAVRSKFLFKIIPR